MHRIVLSVCVDFVLNKCTTTLREGESPVQLIKEDWQLEMQATNSTRKFSCTRLIGLTESCQGRWRLDWRRPISKTRVLPFLHAKWDLRRRTSRGSELRKVFASCSKPDAPPRGSGRLAETSRRANPEGAGRPPPPGNLLPGQLLRSFSAPTPRARSRLLRRPSSLCSDLRWRNSVLFPVSKARAVSGSWAEAGAAPAAGLIVGCRRWEKVPSPHLPGYSSLRRRRAGS